MTTTAIFTQTLEHIPNAMLLVDEHNRITYCNTAMEHVWGYSRVEVIGAQLAMLFPASKTDHASTIENMETVADLDRIEGVSHNVEILDKAGSVIKKNLSISKLNADGVFLYSVFVKDVAEESNARKITDQILEQAIDAVVTIDEHNDITFYNIAAEKLWGYSKAEVMGKKTSECWSPKYFKKTTTIWLMPIERQV